MIICSSKRIRDIARHRQTKRYDQSQIDDWSQRDDQSIETPRVPALRRLRLRERTVPSHLITKPDQTRPKGTKRIREPKGSQLTHTPGVPESQSSRDTRSPRAYMCLKHTVDHTKTRFTVVGRGEAPNYIGRP